MKPVETWKKVTFVGSLIVIATLVSSIAPRRTPEPIPRGVISRPIDASQVSIETSRRDEARKAEEQRLENEKAEFEKLLRRYVNSGFTRKPGKKTVALAVTSPTGNQTLSTALLRRLNSEGAEIYSSFFTPQFVSDGLFTSIFNGSTEVINKLKLSDSLDGLLLARQTVQYSTNSELQNLITANVLLEIMTVSMDGSGQNQAWTFTANGPGFHTADAWAAADERLIKQISNDTKMSLSQISQNNSTH